MPHKENRLYQPYFGILNIKNTAKQNMSSAVCASFLDESLMATPFAHNFGVLVPCSNSNIHVKLCKSRLRIKMSSFLYAYIHYVEFYFRFGHLITFLVLCQLLCGCQGEVSIIETMNRES